MIERKTSLPSSKHSQFIAINNTKVREEALILSNKQSVTSLPC